MLDSFAPGLKLREQNGKGCQLRRTVSCNRASLLEFSQHKLIAAQHKGAVLHFDLDPVELRYLLAGSADASVAVYDVCGTLLGAGDTERCQPVLKIARNNKDCHKYSVTSVSWYPVDTGLLATGSLDNDVKVWDTNTVQAACVFPFESKVYAIGMSPVASAHSLLAVAGNQPQIKLCDPASGSFTHVLGGHETAHREDIWALHWSLLSEWHLATGGCDGQVRMWDIRRSRCIHMFDEQQTEKPSSSVATPVRKRTRDGHLPSRSGPAKLSVAHEGSVTAVLPTADGRHWLTAGTDSRLRLWDSSNYRNLLVNYRNTYNRANKARQIAASIDGKLVFHPSGSVVQVLNMHTGEQQKLLRGHLDTVNACVFNPLLSELYTGADDGSILVWSHEAPEDPNELEGNQIGADRDSWSD